MSRRFQVILEGSGFFIPSEGAKPIRGFFTMCRVMADSPEEAEQKAINKFQQTKVYRLLIETTERELGSRDGCRVRMDSIGHVSWWRWYFNRSSSGFIFYSDDENNA